MPGWGLPLLHLAWPGHSRKEGNCPHQGSAAGIATTPPAAAAAAAARPCQSSSLPPSAAAMLRPWLTTGGQPDGGGGCWARHSARGQPASSRQPSWPASRRGGGEAPAYAGEASGEGPPMPISPPYAGSALPLYWGGCTVLGSTREYWGGPVRRRPPMPRSCQTRWRRAPPAAPAA